MELDRGTSTSYARRRRDPAAQRKKNENYRVQNAESVTASGIGLRCVNPLK